MLNMLRMISVFVLLASCSMLPGRLKTKVDSSSSAAKDQIDEIVKESGFTFDDLQKATGAREAGDPGIREVKLKVIGVGEEFLDSMKDAIESLGEKGTAAQFSEIYGIILGVAGSMQRIGIQKAKDTVEQAFDGVGFANPYERIMNAYNAFLEKLRSVKEKQKSVKAKAFAKVN
nr:DbpA/DbpB family decorin-binding adhesin [Borrelia sp. BU AG58]